MSAREDMPSITPINCSSAAVANKRVSVCFVALEGLWIVESTTRTCVLSPSVSTRLINILSARVFIFEYWHRTLYNTFETVSRNKISTEPKPGRVVCELARCFTANGAVINSRFVVDVSCSYYPEYGYVVLRNVYSFVYNAVIDGSKVTCDILTK